MIISEYHSEHLQIGPSGFLLALWMGSRSTINKIVRGCVRCFGVKPRSVTQLIGNLPQSLVTSSAPFEITGVDYVSPFHIRQGGRKPVVVKTYLCISVC